MRLGCPSSCQYLTGAHEGLQKEREIQLKTHSYVTAQVTRYFAATPERLFDAWLKPEIMFKWLFTSDASDPVGRVCENDARVGGTYFIQDRRNGIDYKANGQYLEIDRPRRIVFTFQMPQFSDTTDKVIIEIEPLDDGCELTLTQEIVVPHEDTLTPDEAAEMLRQYKGATEHGWNEMFELLAKYGGGPGDLIH